MKNLNKSILFAAITLLALAVPTVAAAPSFNAPGHVYIMTNDPAGNQVVIYARQADGSLTWIANVASGGQGMKGLTGSNQGGLVLSQDGKWLFVVNAGTNDVSVLQVTNSGLTLTDRASSGGVMPVSVTIFQKWIYVLNAGNGESEGNIAGFTLDSGHLSLIAGSIQPLSGPATVAQISFNPTGTALAVTEKSTSLIDIYTVNDQGVASGPTSNTSVGSTPFGFAFDNKGHLIVSEAGGGPSGTSAVSSYTLSSTGTLNVISGSVSDTQQAACWLTITGNSRFTYTTNAHSGTISSYSVSSDGTLTLLQVSAANTGPGDLDMSLSRNGQFLYVFVHGSNAIQGYSINSDGSLDLATTVTGVATTADGLASN